MSGKGIDVRWKDLQRWGWTRSIYKSLMLAVRSWVTLCGVYERPIRSEETIEICPFPGLSLRVATPEDLDRACEDSQLGINRDFVTRAHGRGDLCVAVFDDDRRMVAYMWRSFTCAPHKHGLWVHFRKPHRYGYKAYTRPEYRGRHLTDAMGHHLDRYCVERGFTRSIGFIETHNFPSIASDRRRGSRLVGWVGYLNLFGRVYPFRSPGARRRGFGFFRYPKPGCGAAQQTRL